MRGKSTIQWIFKSIWALKKRITLTLWLVVVFSFKICSQEVPQLDTLTLNTGLKVYLLQYGEDSVLNIRLVIDGGKKNETACEVGYSEMIQRLLKQSLKEKRNSGFKNENYTTCKISNGQTVISGSCSGNDLDKEMELLSSTIARLSFNKSNMDKIVSSQIDHYTSEKISASALSTIYRNLIIYGAKNPLGRSYCQYQLEKILPENLREFYAEYYVPKRSSLLICGNFNTRHMKRTIAKHFVKWRSFRKEESIRDDDLKPKIEGREIAFINKRNSKDCLLKWVQPAPSAKSSEHSAFLIACYLFNHYLADKLREISGFGYDTLKFKPISYTTDFTEISCSVSQKKIINAIQLFDTVLKGFTKLNLTNSQLNEAIENLKDKYIKSNTPENILSFYDPLLYNFSARQNYLTNLSRLSVSDLHLILKKYFNPGSYKLIIVGNEHIVSNQLSLTGTITRYHALEFETCDDACKEVIVLKYHCESCYRRGQCNVWKFDPNDKAAIKNAKARTKSNFK